MDENRLRLFDRATAAATEVVAAVKPDQYDDPSPCEGWSVKQVMSHLIGGAKMFTGMIVGGPPVDRSLDHAGDDPLAAFRAAHADLRAAFLSEGAMDRTYTAPFGEAPGTQLVAMRTNEVMVHGWDVAKATGQSTDLDPEVAEACLAMISAVPFIPRGEGKPFAAEQSAPSGATAADRLAAFTGRQV